MTDDERNRLQSLQLDDSLVLYTLGGYLRGTLGSNGIEVPEADMVAMLERFVRGLRDDFASVELAVAAIQGTRPH